MYLAVEPFGTITTYDATLPTGIVERPVKLIVEFEDELAVNTNTPLSDVEIVTFAVNPPVVTTLALSKIGPIKVADCVEVKLAIDILDDNCELLIEPEAIPVIKPVPLADKIVAPVLLRILKLLSESSVIELTVIEPAILSL
jgi:hypothetical protein